MEEAQSIERNFLRDSRARSDLRGSLFLWLLRKQKKFNGQLVVAIC